LFTRIIVAGVLIAATGGERIFIPSRGLKLEENDELLVMIRDESVLIRRRIFF
jgi:hypothetical protein